MMYRAHAVLRFLCFFVFAFLCVPPAHAEEVIFMSPTRVVLNDQKKVEVVIITNLAETSRSYKVSLRNIVMNEKGYTEEVDTFPFSAKRVIRFVPRTFTIPPGGRQVVRVMGRPTPDLPDGDYHVHLEVEEDIFKRPELQNPDPSGSGVAIIAPVEHSALIPIIYSHGKTSAKVGLNGVSIAKGNAENQYNVTVNVTREGNAQGVAVLQFSYIQPNMQKIALGNRSTVQIYREIGKRPYTREVTLPGAPVPGSKIHVALLSEHSPKATILEEDTVAIP